MHPHHRRSLRIPGYDYSQPGYYFVTLCTQDRDLLFGMMQDQWMIPNDLGKLVEACWQEIPHHFPEIALDAFILMPNHLHGILVITGRGTACRAPTSKVHQPAFGKPTAGSLATIIRSFKSAVTRGWHMNLCRVDRPIWQRNYFEYVIRNDRKLAQIREYIASNPAKWLKDKYFSSR